MYFADLSPYGFEDEHDIVGTRAIGWLEAKYPFSQGETSPEFKAVLRFYCSQDMFKMRGFHACEFCPGPPRTMCQEDGLWLGHAEFRVFYQDRVYAAPNLIYHYVLKHNYMPPDEFVTAMLNGPRPGSAKYDTLLQRLPYIW